jgi:phenylpropionate dioxygenase-like ring-hydroxylating dioxygenase large terminal subunit
MFTRSRTQAITLPSISSESRFLIVRGEDGVLRCFYNVCRHRAGNPATGCGNRKLFRCSYHGWTYRLDGALLATPEFEDVEDFDP